MPASRFAHTAALRCPAKPCKNLFGCACYIQHTVTGCYTNCPQDLACRVYQKVRTERNQHLGPDSGQHGLARWLHWPPSLRRHLHAHSPQVRSLPALLCNRALLRRCKVLLGGHHLLRQGVLRSWAEVLWQPLHNHLRSGEPAAGRRGNHGPFSLECTSTGKG